MLLPDYPIADAKPATIAQLLHFQVGIANFFGAAFDTAPTSRFQSNHDQAAPPRRRPGGGGSRPLRFRAGVAAGGAEARNGSVRRPARIPTHPLWFRPWSPVQVLRYASVVSADDSEIARRLRALWERPHTLWGWFATVDHKEIGKRYLVTAFAFLLIGGIEALIMRLQLARPDAGCSPPSSTTRSSRCTASR